MTDTPTAAAAANTPAAAEPKPGTPEWDQAMLAKARAARSGDAGQESNPDAPTRPDNVPEKFWDAKTGTVNTEALLKSYAELEAKGGKSDEATEVDKEGAEAAAKNVVEKAGLDWDTLTKKIVEKGNIEDADFTALEAAGIPRNLAERYIELNKLEAVVAMKEAFDYGGGEEATNDLLNWAATNLPQREIEGYNAILAGPNWRAAIDTLKTLRANASRTKDEPKLLNPGSNVGSVAGFATQDEFRAAMRDPKYRDPSAVGAAYRAEVERRLKASPWRAR